VLDALLVGGLAHGEVFITGDFDHQAIYRRNGSVENGEALPDARATILQRAPGMMALQLKSNVRMTPEVARFVADLIGEPTLYSEHRRSDDDQVSVERHTFTTMAEQQLLLADAVERIAGGARSAEPYTVRDLVILSPYARERSAAGQATDARLTSRLGTTIAGATIVDPTRIRWGTVHEFKGLEAPAVILTDVDLSKEHHRDLLYVGASRATDRLVVLEQVS